MEYLQVNVKRQSFVFNILLLTLFATAVIGYETYHVENSIGSSEGVYIERYREKRDVSATPPSSAPAPAVNQSTPTTLPASQPTAANTIQSSVAPASTNVSDDSNRTSKNATQGTLPTAAVTQVPLLAVSTVEMKEPNATRAAKVSDPIVPDDNDADVFKTPELIKAEHNLTNLQYDNHDFYNSTFIGNLTYFREYWTNITTSKPDVHAVLSNSYRHATALRLSFDFPFYGHPIRNITVATGGFIYIGEHLHNWLAATQYIAPLMANFDTTLTNESLVKLYDDGEKFTALWENVNLQEDKDKLFTFAVTLHANGDIVFSYKDVPIPINEIDDTTHPVKVGISDAYLTDRILFYVRRKTIYEYHRVSFKKHEITNGTILKLIALPTCIQHKNCAECVTHEIGFNCSWCESIQRCSSGTDRNKQDWILRHCDRHLIASENECSPKLNINGEVEQNNTLYSTDNPSPKNNNAEVKIGTADTQPSRKSKMGDVSGAPASVSASTDPEVPRSAVGGAIGLFVAVALIGFLGAWVIYAFKNPHSRSGQILIKYRPSQWSWRRGEARYTAATIHM